MGCGGCKGAKDEKERPAEHELEEAGSLSHEQRQYLLRSILESMTVADVLLPCNLIRIETGGTLKDAWGMLLDKNLSAAPVWSKEDQSYIGFLELQDAVCYIVRMAEAEHNSRGQCLNTLANAALQDFITTPRHLDNRRSSDVKDELALLRDSSMRALEPDLWRTISPQESQEQPDPAPPVPISTRSKERKLRAARDPVEYIACTHRFDPVTVADSLFEVASRLQSERRIPVLDEDGVMCSVISQTRLCMFLNVEQHFWEWQLGHEALKGTVAQFGVQPRTLLKVRTVDTAIFVFCKMRDLMIFSIPVVDITGKLVAVALGKDAVQYLRDPGNVDLHTDILTFLSKVRGKPHTEFQVPTIRFEDEFTTVWDRMAETSAKYVFLVDDHGAPIGVISIGDALRALVSADSQLAELPEVQDVAINSDVEKQAVLLCRVKLDRNPLSDPSERHTSQGTLLTTAHMKYIWAHLPHRVLHHDWRLLFSLDVHGTALATVFSRCKMVRQNEPCVTVIKDTEGNVFGCFCSDPWRIEKGFYGNGEAFLFRFTDRAYYEHIETFHWDPAQPRHIQQSDADSIAIGLGKNGFGLHLDKTLLNGSSAACDTFSSEALSSKERFKVVQVEVWSLGWRELRPVT